MKKFFYAILIASAVFSSCAKEEIADKSTPSNKYFVEIKALSQETKTVFGAKEGTSYPVLWTTGKNATFSLKKASLVDAPPVPSKDGKSAEFSIGFESAPIEDDIIYGFSPKGDYSSNPKVGGFTSVKYGQAGVYAIVPTDQTPLASSVDPSAQLLYGQTTYSSESETSITFSHALAYGKMTITNFGGNGIKSVDITFPENVAGTSVVYSFDEKTFSGADVEKITLDPANMSDNTLWFGILPTGELSSGEIEITITDNDDKRYIKTIDLTKKSITFTAGRISTFSVTFSGITPDTTVKNTFTISTLATKNGWENGKRYSPLSSDDSDNTNISLETSSNSGLYYTSGTNWRLYNGGTLDVKGISSSIFISKIEIEGSSLNYLSTSTGTYTSETGVWTGSANVISFSVSGTVKITEINVYYKVKELTSITIDGNLTTTEYTKDSNVDFSGLTATGNYSDDTTQDLTSVVEWASDPETLDEIGDNINVTITATSGEIVGSKQYTVKVKGGQEITWTRSGTTDTVTSGYTLEKTKTSGKSGYYQDGGSVGDDTILKITKTSASDPIFSEQPSSITFTAKIGGGSVKDNLTNSVYVCLIDGSGNEISGTSVIVTDKVEVTTGKEYSVTISSVEKAYGVKLSHIKESGYNVRFYGMSLKIE